ncbi:MAG: uracil-DNA glycosylase family protein [Candidatus Hermodarchaeota archaeon]
MTDNNTARIDALNALAEEIRQCTRCRLHETRTQAVPGDGCPTASILFCGEAPGKSEDKQGIPFVGAAGKLLSKNLEAIGLKREDVFIANVVKCIPLNESLTKIRPPRKDEIQACRPFLEKQLEYINPRVVIPLGNFSLKTLLDPALQISQARAKIFEKEGRVYFPMFHPSVGLYNPSQRDLLLEDFKALAELLNLSKIEINEKKNNKGQKTLDDFMNKRKETENS